MFENVLVGVDGRPGGSDAIALARLLSDPGGKLTFVFVRSSEIAEDVAESEELLERERSAADLEAELLSVISLNPGRGLHEQAERRGADRPWSAPAATAAFGRAMLSDDTRAAQRRPLCGRGSVGGYAEHHNAISGSGSPTTVRLRAPRRSPWLGGSRRRAGRRSMLWKSSRSRLPRLVAWLPPPARRPSTRCSRKPAIA